MPNLLTGRILIVAPSYYCLGGVATWLDYLLPGLERLGWEPVLGLVAGFRFHNADRYLVDHQAKHARKIYCHWGTQAERIYAIRSAIRSAKVSMVLSVNIPDAILAAAVERRQSSVRAVMTCHGIEPELFADMKTLRNQLDAVVCTNRLACMLAQEPGAVSAERVFHAPYGTKVPVAIPESLEKPELVIGYSGRLEESQKRISDVIQIAIQLKNAGMQFRFRIAGTGPAESSIREQVTAAGLDSRFEFLGFIAPAAMKAEFYQTCNVLLVTSSWETGPIVIWEAMANGVPVVSSRYVGSGQEQLLKHEQNCLLFETGCADQAAQCLMRLSKEEGLSHRLRQCAHDFAVDRLTEEHSVNNWHNILLKIQQMAPISGVAGTAGDEERFESLAITGLKLKATHQIRRILGRTPMNAGPGGEWPHTLNGRIQNESQEYFWDTALRLDRRTPAQESISQ